MFQVVASIILNSVVRTTGSPRTCSRNLSRTLYSVI